MKRSALGAALLVLGFASAMYGAPQRTFVSSAGNDTNDCTRATPCRNFAAAIAAVNAGGEVVVLDSAGFGAVFVNKSVSIIAPPGVYAGITGFSGYALNVDATGGDSVVLRGLSLNGLGATTGIQIVATGSLRVEKCDVSHFTGSGISIPAASAPMTLIFRETTSRSNGSEGINLIGNIGVPITATLDRVVVDQNLDGLVADLGTRVVVTNSSATSNVTAGFRADHLGVLEVFNSIASANQTGFVAAHGSTIYIGHSAALNNGASFQITQAQMGSGIASKGDNMFAANGPDTGTLTAFPPQ